MSVTPDSNAGSAKRPLANCRLDLGFGTFCLIGPPDADMLRTFIEDVASRVREAVAAGRARELASADQGATP
jgi:hypothetical protein